MWEGKLVFASAQSNRRIYSEFDLSWLYNVNDYVSLMIGGGLLSFLGDSINNQKMQLTQLIYKQTQLQLIIIFYWDRVELHRKRICSFFN